MDIDRINALGRELDCFLRLKTHSLGITLFRKSSDIPSSF